MPQSDNARLTGKQMKQLADGLRSAFVNFNDLGKVVRVALDKRLGEVVDERADFEAQVWQLVEWVKARHLVKELCLAAIDEVPRNPELRAAVEVVLGERTQGKPTAEDTAAANDLIRQHRIETERPETIIGDEREGWQKSPPKEPRPGDVTSVDLGGVEMKFAWCPPGTFMMGSPPHEEGRNEDETQHRVTLTRGYWMGVYPVTQAQWQAVMGSNPSHFKGDSLPVEMVSWDDCQDFVKKLGEKTGKQFRLPTEAEWEYACRAGTTTPFHFGETISTDQANHYDNDASVAPEPCWYWEEPTPVGSFPANTWGLYDMHGNVWEWCQDWYGPYGKNDISDPREFNSESVRVMRGGSWEGDSGDCRSACRDWDDPGSRYADYGCRVLLCLD